MATDTTDPNYWLNWRFLICALYILGITVFSTFLIWKYEGKKKLDNERRERGIIPVGVLYKDEVWKTCLKSIHPAFLLAFRLFAFVLLLAVIVSNTIAKGPGIFFYYTQWTFTLTTIYFGFASAFSLYGCWRDCGEDCHSKAASQNIDAEPGSNVAPKLEGSANTSLLNSLIIQEVHVHHVAGCTGYLLQIMYQVAAGAVLLTDVVFWLLIYPFLTGKDYRLAFLTFYQLSHPWGLNFELHEVPYVPYCLFYLVDRSVCCRSMDNPCLCFPQVALSIHGLVTSICSDMVCHSGFVAHPMLWSLCSDSQIKAPMAFKIIFRVLSGYKVIRIRSVNFVQENTSPCKD